MWQELHFEYVGDFLMEQLGQFLDLEKTIGFCIMGTKGSTQ